MKILYIALLCFGFMSLFSQQKIDPIKWSFDINQIGPKDYELVYMAKIDEPWVIYSKDTSEGGPIPTSVTYTSDNVVVRDQGTEMGDRKEGFDSMFDTEVIKYTSKKDYILKQKVTVTNPEKAVTGYVTYMLCNNDMCLPPRDVDFNFTIKVMSPMQVVPSKGKTQVKKAY